MSISALQPHAQTWATTIAEVLATPWPYAAAHASRGPEDCDVTPSRLHPMFHASLDWHSSAHMQWSAITLLHHTALPEGTRDALTAELDSRLTDENGQVEATYLADHPGYERPYGWGWVATLTAGATALAADTAHPLAARARTWATALQPVADQVGDHLIAWLPKLAFPIRHGVHSNTAFGLTLARDAFEALGVDDVVTAIDRAAREFFLPDVDYPSSWEPSGADFLSPALCEADLMRRVLPHQEFGAWLNTFLPVLAEPGERLLQMPVVLDETDGHAVHLHGLALSRAAQLRALAPFLEAPRATAARSAADELVAHASAAISEGDFMSTHWLVSFAVLAALME
ncbi:DUF2891 family protein [Aestuariimicrobium sp. T2.26MG-19.2B]|uniref:DUF2891 family protein n=1 Tax=Aestuariimicrobium sp. T2.26MG-19.2B TaxID=3040679 RepID=UPI0024774A0C|nr:DUF2891 family protein [Aestuariimicrobium sp. T2.26MG-19.2B]CAI9399549.1 hypothetical protein AESSP_00213 [Aestuariimicrobium sp. T2.26MG-19.2B]